MTEPILVWRYRDAPADLQTLSTHGGDEDWLALLPAGCEPPDWTDTGTPFGYCRVREYTSLQGVVLIGAHA